MQLLLFFCVRGNPFVVVKKSNKTRMEAGPVKNQDSVSQLQPLCPAAPETRKFNGFPFMSVYELGVNESYSNGRTHSWTKSNGFMRL